SRRGGLHENVPIEKIIAEIADYLKLSEVESSILVERPLKLVKNEYIKNTPEASKKNIADAAWLAVNYFDRVGSSETTKTSNMFERALVFYDVLTSLKVYPTDSIGIGIINPRSDVPTHELSAWYETNFVVKTPDALYFMPLFNAIFPGELPGEFKGETAFIFPGNRRKLSKKTVIESYTVPGKKVTENSGLFMDTVTIDSDDILRMSSLATFKGSVKTVLEDVVDTVEWIRDIEKTLTIPAYQRYRSRKYDVEGREDELKSLYASYLKNFYGREPDSLLAVDVMSRGITSENPDMIIHTESEFSGLVERLGDDISVSVGRLTGMPEPLTDNERNRLLDVMLPFIS
ncbi:MAG: hypothetical protein K2K84_03235, partial [Muribaculaceae bacterium]|nr:hypothetical protein [Muribaculaceae bacterium]